MLTIFFFFLLCICSILASAPWLNEGKPNSTLIEGDIALVDAPDSNEQTSAIEDYQVNASASSPWNRKWENNIVPFTLSSGFSTKQRKTILAAMIEIHQKTCISFVKREQETDFIFFLKLPDRSLCSSLLGRKGGPQHVNLTDECVERNTVLHELMNVLGFQHEHSRHDKDNKRKTIISKVKEDKVKSDGLSEIDVWKINYIYNCSNEGENVEISNENAEDTRTITEISIGTTSTTTRPISILNKEIVEAVEVGNEAAVRKLLNDGADVNARTIGEYRNNTLLHIASENGHQNVVSLLFAHGANVNDKDKPLGDAAIHKAAKHGYANIVSLLLAHNVSVEMKGEYDNTPLHCAAGGGHVNVVSLLLDKGANIEARSISNTPLHYAAWYDHVNVVSLLLDRGANIEAKDTSNLTPVHYAALRGHVNVVSLLLDKGANIEAKSTSNWTPLHYAAWYGQVNVVSLLLDRDANIEAKDTSNLTPVHYAALHGHVNVVSLILDKGANIEARSTSHLTPLHFAARDGLVNVVSLLLDKGANIEAKSTSNWTPLHYAAWHGHVNVVSLLLERDANIEAKDTSNLTPVHYAALRGHVNVVSLLLDKGANIEARSTSNWTPLHYAAWYGQVNVVSLLLGKGANIEARSTSNWTPLHYAAWHGHVNVVSLLLDNGANIFAKGRWYYVDYTPLDMAKRGYNTETVKILERKERQLTG